VHLGHPGEHLDSGRSREQLARDGAGGDTPDGLARTGAAAALPVPDAVLGLGGVVGVGGPEHVLHVLVGLGTRVLVADHHRDRRADRLPLEQPRDDLGLVGLLARRGEPALPRTPAIQVPLDLGHVDREPRRAAVHHHPHGPAVGLAEGGDAKQRAEGAGHGR
jgi:hypothetical protein